LSGLALNLKHLVTARAQRGTLPNGCASAVPLCSGMRSRNRFLHARTRDVEGISRAKWYLCVSYRWNMWTMAARETKRPLLASRQAMQPQKGVMLGLGSSLAAPSQTASTRPAEMARSKLQSTDRGTQFGHSMSPLMPNLNHRCVSGKFTAPRQLYI